MKKKTMKTATCISGAVIAKLIVPFLFLLSVIGIICLPSTISKLEFKKELKQISYETDASNLVYDLSGMLYTKDKKINMNRYCEKQKTDVSYADTLCVYQDKVYFVCTTAKEEWAIASVDLDSKDFEIYCALSNRGFSTEEKVYDQSCNSGKYSERNGYVYGEKIVLNNKHSVLVFDVKTEQYQTYPYEEFAFPEETVYAEIISSKEVLLHIDEETLLCTPETLSENSSAMKQLSSLQDEAIPDSDLKRLDSFYYNKSIQQVGEEIYSVNRLLTSQGDVFYALFKLDKNTKKWSYVRPIYEGYYEEDAFSLVKTII